MLSSSSLSNSSPIFYVDNNVSYLVDDSTYFSTSYYHSPSPLIYNNEIDNLYDFNPNHDLALVQQSILAYSNDNNNTSSIDVTDDSSILELDTKVESNKSGDHESEIFNGIVEDNGEMNHIITSSTTTNTNTNTNTTTTTSSHHRGTTKKRRTSNKDRHSKIRTAHGLRDRRMRLSLQVARPFFKLQDMLGYDKASATVEWLMMQAKPAINELFQSKHGSPPSGITTAKCTTPSSHPDDCEVESTTIIEDKEGSDSNKKRVLSAPTTKEESKQKRKRTTKEERKVARERAKRRTLEKIQSRTQVNEGANNNNNNTNCFTTLSDDYQHSSNVCQNVPGYRNPAQQNTMEGPQ